jgi:hypothetical protein
MPRHGGLAVGFPTMRPESLRELHRLLTEVRVLTLALPVEDEIVLGVLPFLADADLGAVIVHASRLAKHSKGLRAGATFSAAVHLPDGPETDPLALPRLLTAGSVEAIAEVEGRRLESAWVARFPSAVMTLGLGDFAFHRLRLERGRLITGFAQAYAVGPRQLAEAAALRSA